VAASSVPDSPCAGSAYNPPEDAPIQIHFADRDLAVVEKPAGLLSVPGRGPDKGDCLISRVRRDLPEALIVHRLDMETSGLLILALNSEAHRALSAAFEKRRVSKVYRAIVHGAVESASGQIDLPLIADWPNRPRQKIDSDQGKPALTEWQRLNVNGVQSQLDLYPITGRSHQLRVHLDAIGHPILGDTLYGTQESRFATSRLMLHARQLGFEHPRTRCRMEFASIPPF